MINFILRYIHRSDAKVFPGTVTEINAQKPGLPSPAFANSSPTSPSVMALVYEI